MFVLGKKGPKRELGVALTLIQSNLKDCQESGIVEQKGKKHNKSHNTGSKGHLYL